MQIIRTAMLLAAGRGERMRPLTDSKPKPLAAVADKPLIQYHVERLAAAGVQRIVINTAWLGAQISEALGNGERFGVALRYSHEGDEALETGGGIFRALPLLGSDPFWVVSSDLWTDYPFAERSAQLATADLAHLVMVSNPSFHPRGDFCLESGRVSVSQGQRLTYASLAIMRPELFAGCAPGRFPVAPLLRAAMAQERVSGELYEGAWHNIGTTAQLQDLNAQLRAKC